VKDCRAALFDRHGWTVVQSALVNVLHRLEACGAWASGMQAYQVQWPVRLLSFSRS
jgi:hypothetical protein